MDNRITEETKRYALSGAIERTSKYPDNNLPIDEMRSRIKSGNYGWDNGTESWPPDDDDEE